jgi:dTDP-4-amino-4,6-dideoxygalactose transaminase
VHLQSGYSDLGFREGDFPVSEMLAREELSLPLYPELTHDQIHTVARALRTAAS